MRHNVICSVGTRSRDLRVYLNWFTLSTNLADLIVKSAVMFRDNIGAGYHPSGGLLN